MRRTIYYYYNRHAGLVIRYSDSNGNHATRSYMFYSFRDALQKFRKEFGLQRKHIRLVDLYKEPLTCSTKSKK